MDGVSFSPVSSSSLQRQAGNQICRYRSPLACYGNKARHMCFSVCVFVCLCAAAVRVLGEGERCEKEMRVYLSEGYTFTSSNSRAKYTRPHREIKCRPHELNFSSCEYFDNTDYVYIHGDFPSERDFSSRF